MCRFLNSRNPDHVVSMISIIFGSFNAKPLDVFKIPSFSLNDKDGSIFVSVTNGACSSSCSSADRTETTYRLLMDDRYCIVQIQTQKMIPSGRLMISHKNGNQKNTMMINGYTMNPRVNMIDAVTRMIQKSCPD